MIDGGRFEVSDDKEVGVGGGVFFKNLPVVFWLERVVLKFLIDVGVFFCSFTVDQEGVSVFVSNPGDDGLNSGFFSREDGGFRFDVLNDWRIVIFFGGELVVF